MRSVTLTLTSEQRRFLNLLLFDDEAEDIAYGGARGGNKTAMGCIAMLLRRLKYPGTRGICLRKTEKAVVKNIKDEMIKWAKALGLKLGADIIWQEAKKNFLIYNGSEIELASVWNDQSYENIIGLQYTDVWWEEAVQHTREKVALVNGSCRTDVHGCRPKKWYTTNPGGVGHTYLYEDFVDPKTRLEENRWVRSTLRNALPTLVNDPGYLKRVAKGLPAYKRAQWIEGDWAAMAGQYFDIDPIVLCEAKDKDGLLGKYALQPGGIPYWATWYGGVDYGDNAPFCVLFAAVWNDPTNNTDHIHFVSEIYQRRLDVDTQAFYAREREKELAPIYRMNNDVIYYGDPAINFPIPSLSHDVDRTVRQMWGKYGWVVIPSHRELRTSGWQQMRMLMKDKVMTISPSGCPALIKELRGACYENPESSKSEDIAKENPDHALTAASYLLRKLFMGGYQGEEEDPYAPRPKPRPKDSYAKV